MSYPASSPAKRARESSPDTDSSEPNTLQIEELLIESFREGCTVEQATEIVAERLNLSYVTKVPFSLWLHEFNAGRICSASFKCAIFFQLLNQAKLLYAERTNAVYSEPNDGEYDNFSMISVDENGRVGIAMDTGRNKINRFQLVDVFRGTECQVLLPMRFEKPVSKPQFIDRNHFLLCDCKRICLLELNTKNLACSLLHSTTLPYDFKPDSIVLDELDQSRFLIHNDAFSAFLIGNVSNGRIRKKIIQFDAWDSPVHRLFYVRLVGNKIYGLLDTQDEEPLILYHAYVFDLKTNTEEFIDIEQSFHCPILEQWAEYESFHPEENAWTWFGNSLYIAVNFDESFHIYVLDMEKCAWFRTNISVHGKAINLSVTSRGILTVSATTTESEGGGVFTVYRFPIGKPDTVRNLAWFTMRRAEMFSGKMIDERHIPFNSDLKQTIGHYLKFYC